MNEVDETNSASLYLSTHPTHEQRAHDLDKIIPGALLLREECKCYALPKQLPQVVDKKEKTNLAKKIQTKVI